MAIPKLALIPSGIADNQVFSVLPSNGDGDFDFTRGSTATRVNAQGLIETVTNDAPRLNYPLLDGVVQECPSLLLEPQSRSILTHSNNYDDSSWTKTEVTNSSNNSISPDGTQNANLVIPSTTLQDDHRIQKAFATVPIINNFYTYSVFVKPTENYKGLTINLAASRCYASFDLENKLVLKTFSNGTSASQESAKIEDYGNGWLKISLTAYILETSIAYFRLIPNQIASASYNQDGQTYSGDGVTGLLFYGSQWEENSYSTSYIPTTTSAVTRLAETCNGAGTSDTFNDAEGVLMVETSALNEDTTIEAISISDGSSQNRVVFMYWNVINQIKARVTSSNSNQFDVNISVPSVTNNNKLAIKYKQNDFAFWINGIKVSTDISGNTPIGLNTLEFNSNGQVGADFYGNTKQIQYFDSTLTDSELEKLTSWTSFTDMAEAQLYTIE